MGVSKLEDLQQWDQWDTKKRYEGTNGLIILRLVYRIDQDASASCFSHMFLSSSILFNPVQAISVA